MKIHFQEKIRFGLKRLMVWFKPQLEKVKIGWQPQQEKLLAWAGPHLAQGKARWENLTSSEKSTILVGASFAVILLLYALIWSPLTTHLDNLRVQIQGEKKTAAWIQAADKQIRSLETKQGSSSTQTLSRRLNLIQEEIRQAPLNATLTQLTQSNTDEIHCIFDHVDFDALVAWLMAFSQKHELTIKQASVKRLNNVGLVQAEFVFKA